MYHRGTSAGLSTNVSMRTMTLFLPPGVLFGFETSIEVIIVSASRLKFTGFHNVKQLRILRRSPRKFWAEPACNTALGREPGASVIEQRTMFREKGGFC